MPLPDPPAGTARHRLAEQPQPRRRFRFDDVPAWLWVVFALVVCALVVTLVYGFSRDATPARTPAGVPVVPISTPAAAPAPPAPSADLPEGAFSGDDRVYEVGVDMPAGSYVSQGSLDPDAAGTWERRRYQSSQRSTAPVAEGTSFGPTTVTLRAGDLFKSVGFKPWHRGP